MFLEITLMYSQIIFGPRFFTCSKEMEDRYSLYHSKEELLNKNKNFETADCLICLNSLLNITITDPEKNNETIITTNTTELNTDISTDLKQKVNNVKAKSPVSLTSKEEEEEEICNDSFCNKEIIISPKIKDLNNEECLNSPNLCSHRLNRNNLSTDQRVKRSLPSKIGNLSSTSLSSLKSYNSKQPANAIVYLTSELYFEYEEVRTKISYACVKNVCSRFFNKFFEFHESRWGRKTFFMLTKCNHAFHSECLENWLRQKPECPTCRSEIIY